jgi:hypothetical protein
MANRTAAERSADALRRLETEPNVWIATASPEGVPHNVPLSLAWTGTEILVASPSDNPTVRNARSTGRARACLDSATNVVVIDAEVSATPLAQADPSVLQSYIQRVGWDPRHERGDWSLLTLTPRRVQSWNGVDEIEGRTIMRDGRWTANSVT